MQVDLEQKIRALAESMGFVLYDMMWAKENEHSILRVFLNKELDSESLKVLKSLQSRGFIESSELESLPKREGITLEECARFSEALSPMLDVELTHTNAYFLEVSSPGLERVLKKEEHFFYSLLEEISIKRADKSEVSGLLVGLNENTESTEFAGALLLEIVDSNKSRTSKNTAAPTKEKIFVSFAEIKKAKSVFRF
ncbi:ribosome maturation factor RimP [Helicobacter himalayensis]|uniref:ribosome maturation factor RimP n=1 Tax=Helicobacter himalayensis TaxID=1591088 RepID=UPI003D6F595A